MSNLFNQNDVICFRKIYNKWAAFTEKENIGDSIKDGLIITAITTRVFFALKAANLKPSKISLDAMDIMKLVSEICEVVLVKDYAVYKKCINE